jgi:hypothetical protein
MKGKRRKGRLENGMEMEMECRGRGKTEYAKENTVVNSHKIKHGDCKLIEGRKLES